jgi:methionine synthase II (cobalamin-independent)
MKRLMEGASMGANFRESRQYDDPFSQLMFGKRKHQESAFSKDQKITDSIEKYLNQIDLDLLYKNIDAFMETAAKLKPLYEQLSPVIMKLIKKADK